MRVSRRAASWVALPILIAALPGCVQPLAQRGAEGSVQGLYEGFDDVDPALRQRVHRMLLDDPELREAAAELTRAAVAGALSAFSDVDVEGGLDGFLREVGGALQSAARDVLDYAFDRLDRSVDRAMDRLDRSIGQALDALAAELPDVVRSAVQALGESLRGGATDDLAQAAERITAGATNGFLAALERWTREIWPDGATVEDLADGAGLVARSMAREAAVGLREGLGLDARLDTPAIESRVQHLGYAAGRGLGEGIAEGLGDTFSDSSVDTILTLILIGLLLAIVMLAVGLAVLWRRVSRASDRVGDAAGDVRGASEQHREELHALVSGLREAAANRDDLAWVEKYLKDKGF